MIKSHIVYQNAFRSLSEKIKLEGSLGALVRSFTGTLPLVDPDKRLNDYFVKVPYQINYSAKIDSPSEYHKGIVFQSGSNVENGLLELQNQHEIKSNEIELRYQFSLARGVVKKDAYDAFYSAFEAALLESQWVITFLFDNANYKKHALVQQGDDVEAMVKLAQHHLFLGEYEDAVSIGKRTIKLFPEHGGAHYVLGLSYGFIDEFEQSDREIRKAKSLGYRP